MRELHLHLDGSLRPQTVLDLYRQEGLVPPKDNVEDLGKMLIANPDAKDLAEVLQVFNIPLKVMQKEYALRRVAKEVVQDLKKAGNDYTEIRFAPQLSTNQGLTQKQVLDAVIEGIQEGMKENDIQIKLLLCLMRGGSKEANIETVHLAHEYLGHYVCGLDLAGDENNYPCRLYEDEFALARSFGIPFTIHAGESQSIDNVKDAIAFGAKRLGHGCTIIRDREVMHIVKEKGILVECCLTSNLQTKEVPDMTKHPIRDYFDYGIRVNINSDNMTVSDTTIEKERLLAKKNCHFTDEELSKIDEYAKEASF